MLSQSSVSSDEEETAILNNTRPVTPLVLNPIDLTSCWDVFGYETDLGVKAEPNPRLPTPEERMRQQADAVTTEVVPINITGGHRALDTGRNAIFTLTWNDEWSTVEVEMLPNHLTITSQVVS